MDSWGVLLSTALGQFLVLSYQVVIGPPLHHIARYYQPPTSKTSPNGLEVALNPKVARHYVNWHSSINFHGVIFWERYAAKIGGKYSIPTRVSCHSRPDTAEYALRLPLS